MPLNKTLCASAIWSGYASGAGIDSSGNVVMNDGEHTIDLDFDYGKNFADAYNDYAMLGIVLGTTNAGGQKDILVSAWNSFVGGSGSAANISTLATALSTYWATVCDQTQIGPPSHGGISVVSSVNDAATKAPLFIAAITSVITDSASTPPFEDFIGALESVSSTIIWLITELIPAPPGAPVPIIFPETMT